MKTDRFLMAAAIAAAMAAPVAAQTTNDDMSATENWWDKVGADFFGEGTLWTLRPEAEIRAQWTGLSADDQAAVLARCAAGEGREVPDAVSTQEGDEDNDPEATATEMADLEAPEAESGDSEETNDQTSTTTGSIDGQERQETGTDSEAAAYTGLAGGMQDGAPPMAVVCDLIPTL